MSHLTVIDIVVLVALFAVIITPYAFVFYTVARLWGEIRGMQNSTHRIEYRDPYEALRESDTIEVSEGKKTEDEELEDDDDPLEDNVR